ncbi:hypothetical protein PybrP1_002877 [[Pythium] brassicae (nom. inval.)]|nr:hypothetical protein PybrP1_002877 [[Pythium] brassicae (nom. inval.)]
MKGQPAPLFGGGATAGRDRSDSAIAIMEVAGGAAGGHGNDWVALDSTNHAGAVALLGGEPARPSKRRNPQNRHRYSSGSVEERRSNASRVSRKLAQARTRKVPHFRLTEMDDAAPDADADADAAAADDAQRKSAADPTVSLFNRKHSGLLISVAFASLMSVGLKRGVLPLMQTQLKMEHGDTSVAKEEKEAIIGGYVFLLGAACFGEILSVMMAEIYVIAFSKRETLLQRGHMVGTFLCVQFGFQFIGQVITDAVVFRIGSGGAMLPYIGFQDIVIFFAVYSLVPIPIICYFFDDHLPASDSDDDSEDADDLVDTGQSSSGSVILECSSSCERGGGSDDLEQQQQPPSGARRRTAAASKPTTVWLKTKTHWQLLWATLQQKATWQIVCFLCVFIFFAEFTLRYPFVVLDQWTGVTAKSISTGKIYTEFMFFLAAAVWKALCVNTQWGTFVALSYLGVFIFPPMTFFLLATYGVSSNLQLYMFVSSFQGFIRAMAVVLDVVMMIEIAPAGGEGAVLGTIVSIAAIMRLISQTFSNSIGYLFGTQVLLTRKDSGAATSTAAADAAAADEPMLVATALILCYTLRLLALVGVLFLPSQKVGLRKLLASGGQKSYRAWWTLGILLVSFLVGTLVNTLVITPDTMCLHALGGSGCSS